jgi:hypothetical protein
VRTISVSTAIRTGILLGEQHNNLVELTFSLLISMFSNPEKCREITHVYIAEVQQFDRVTLLDNLEVATGTHCIQKKLRSFYIVTVF